jgi:hypothetical protein
VAQIFINTTVLPPLSRAEAQMAATRTAGLVSLTLDDDLLAAMLDDLGGDAIDPSRLQFVCSTLAERLAAGDKRLTLAAYQGLGRASGILTEYLNSVLTRGFPPPDRESAWRLLAALVEGRGGGAPTEGSLIGLLRSYGVPQADARRVLSLLEANRLVRRRDDAFELASESLRPRIQEWAAGRAAAEQAREEALRQVEQVRASALRGLVGGAVGFSLGYLVAYASQMRDSSLLGYTTAYRSAPGAVAGLLLALAVDVALASYHGPRRPLRWLVGGLGGAGAFALAVGFHALLRTQDVILGALEGAMWGLVTGLGAIWVLTDRRPLWQTLSASVAASAVAVGLADLVGHAYGTPASPLLVPLGGAIMAACVLGAVALARAGGRRAGG